MSIPVYVVIPSHRRSALIMRTIHSLSECALPESYHGTVIVENGSRSRSVERFVGSDARLNASYVFTPVGNKSLALNRAVRELPAEALVIFFDDDILIHPYTLIAYAKAADEVPEASYFAGPVFSDFSEGAPPAWLRHYLPASVSGWSLGPHREEIGTKNFMGANWAARQRQLAHAGLFDPSVGPGGTSGARGQETAMQRALTRRGARGIYVPHAVVWHYVPSDRCSPDWVVGRAFAINKGRSRELRQAKPWVLIVQLIRTVSTYLPIALALALIGPFLSEHKKFWLRFRLHCALGYLSGLRTRTVTKRSGQN